MKNKIDGKLFLYLCIGFIVATIIGTLTHELGHFFVAKYLGYNAQINYQSTWLTNSTQDKLMSSQERFLFTLGGPLETVLTGTIGILLLFRFRKFYQNVEKLSFGQWTIIFVTLFWLRQTANFVVWCCSYLFRGNISNCGDEIKLAHFLKFPSWTIVFFTAIIGAIVLAIVIFNFIPARQRLTFILSGLVGGVTGYLIWLESIGKLIMP